MKELKYKKIFDTILSLIHEGFWAPNEKIYSERHFAELYAVSRLTVRRALSELLAEGYLEYNEGRQGTFVSDPVLKSKKGIRVVANENLIGVAVDNHTPEFATQLLQGIHDSLWDLGFHTIYCNTYLEGNQIFSRIQSLVIENAVKGFIFSPLIGIEFQETNLKIIDFLTSYDIPFLLVDRYIENQLHNHVVINDRVCFNQMTKKLISMGHSRILLIRGLEATSTTQRVKGFREAFEQTETDISGALDVYCNEQKFAKDYKIPPEVLSAVKKMGDFTAIIGMNKLLARIGREIAIKAGKDVIIGTIAVNPLDSESDLTIIHPVYNMGKESGKLLIKLIQERPLPITHIILKAYM